MIHILLPFRTKWSPLKSARSFIDTTSDPALGSDMASAPTCSPDTSLGRYFWRWVSVPLRMIWFTHRLECAPYDRPTEAEPREISSIATTWAR